MITRADRRELLWGAGKAFSYFVLLKIADWLVGGAAVSTFGPQLGGRVHAAVLALALLAFVARGIFRLRDRFSVAVGAAVLAAPLAAYLLAAW